MTAENAPEIIAHTKREWRLMDPSGGPEFESFINLPPGSHQLEIKPNPYGRDEIWFVLKGTSIGKPMESWRGFEDRMDDFQIIIQGSTPPPERNHPDVK